MRDPDEQQRPAVQHLNLQKNPTNVQADIIEIYYASIRIYIFFLVTITVGELAKSSLIHRRTGSDQVLSFISHVSDLPLTPLAHPTRSAPPCPPELDQTPSEPVHTLGISVAERESRTRASSRKSNEEHNLQR